MAHKLNPVLRSQAVISLWGGGGCRGPREPWALAVLLRVRGVRARDLGASLRLHCFQWTPQQMDRAAGILVDASSLWLVYNCVRSPTHDTGQKRPPSDGGQLQHTSSGEPEPTESARVYRLRKASRGSGEAEGEESGETEEEAAHRRGAISCTDSHGGMAPLCRQMRGDVGGHSPGCRSGASCRIRCRNAEAQISKCTFLREEASLALKGGQRHRQ